MMMGVVQSEYDADHGDWKDCGSSQSARWRRSVVSFVPNVGIVRARLQVVLWRLIRSCEMDGDQAVSRKKQRDMVEDRGSRRIR
jgi:hypothetical protein